MERLLKELMCEKQKLELLKGEVNDMEYDALQRRFRRVNNTSFIPRVQRPSQRYKHEDTGLFHQAGLFSKLHYFTVRSVQLEFS